MCLVVGLITWFIPTPSGLEPAAWHLFAIFLATIVGIIGKAAPMGALSVIAMALCAATGVVAPDGDAGDRISQALSGFSNSTIWLIVSAFFAARAVIASGLGERLAYLFVKVSAGRPSGSPTVWGSPICSPPRRSRPTPRARATCTRS